MIFTLGSDREKLEKGDSPKETLRERVQNCNFRVQRCNDQVLNRFRVQTAKLRVPTRNVSNQCDRPYTGVLFRHLSKKRATPPMRILLVEDDEILLGVLLQALSTQHYVVDTAEDGQSGWEYAQSGSYDLILLDVGLPRLDGIALCQRLRSTGCSTPILLITARDASTDRVRGLDAGADDYLVKPLDLAELQARVRALLRRGEVAHTSVLQVGELSLDPRSCEVSYKGNPLVLTPKEYTLLELLLRNPSRVFSRGQIVEHLWTFDDPPQEDSVKAHIKGLRQKLKAAGAVDWIENVYGLGYRLRQEAAETSRQADQAIGKDDARLSPLHAPSPAAEQQFSQSMSQLWEQYRDLMAQRMAVLQAAAIATQTGNLTEALRQDASRAAHKLAGVLGMFDRDAGTVWARELEQLLLAPGTLLPAQEQQLLSLVQALDNLLNLPALQIPEPQVSERQAEPSPETTRLLLIALDRALGKELQALTRSQGIGWKQVETLALAKSWLQSHLPSLVVLSVDQVAQRDESLMLIKDLSARTPSVPVLVLAASDGLLDRVTVARAGGQGFLVRPVTAVQVWAGANQLMQRNRSLSVNVLVVDDDPIFLAALPPMLEPWGIRVTGLENSRHFWETLRSTSPDLLILDVDMPQFNGIELCQAVRIDPNWQGLPILFLTGHRDRATIQQVFAAGADDYIVKPVVEPELLTRITNRLDRTRLLQTLAHKDPLTGLANQPQSHRDLEYLLLQAATMHRPVCLALFSIMQLHQINLQYGHTMGNQLLQQWGRKFQAAFRGSEPVGYWGNGEFVVGLPGLTKTEASDRLSELLMTLRQQVFTVPDGSHLQAIVRFGLAEYPTDGMTLQSLYQAANQPLP